MPISRAVALRLIRRYEERKAAGDYEKILASNASYLIWALRESGLTEAQIECATKEQLNKLIIEKILREVAQG